MKAIFAGLLVAAVNASASDFPQLDAMHAHCQINTVYPKRTCEKVFNEIDATIKSFENQAPNKSIFKFVETGKDTFVWATATAGDASTVEDTMFTLTQSGEDCAVEARSRT